MVGGIQIGQVSARTGLSVDAIRFYEKQRLLERPRRTNGGFRLFQTEDIRRIEFIRRAQQLGFSLPEIRELLLLHRENGEACSHVRDRVRAKLNLVREKIQELSALERQLSEKLRQCERNLKALRACDRDACPVLREISKQHRHDN